MVVAPAPPTLRGASVMPLLMTSLTDNFYTKVQLASRLLVYQTVEYIRSQSHIPLLPTLEGSFRMYQCSGIDLSIAFFPTKFYIPRLPPPR